MIEPLKKIFFFNLKYVLLNHIKKYQKEAIINQFLNKYLFDKKIFQSKINGFCTK